MEIKLSPIQQHVYDSITWDGYEDSEPEDLLQFLNDTFVSEFQHEINRQGYQKALREWLSGLPSSFSVVYTNYGIYTKGVELGLIKDDISEEDLEFFVGNWFKLIAFTTYRMINRNFA